MFSLQAVAKFASKWLLIATAADKQQLCLGWRAGVPRAVAVTPPASWAGIHWGTRKGTNQQHCGEPAQTTFLRAGKPD